MLFIDCFSTAILFGEENPRREWLESWSPCRPNKEDVAGFFWVEGGRGEVEVEDSWPSFKKKLVWCFIMIFLKTIRFDSFEAFSQVPRRIRPASSHFRIGISKKKTKKTVTISHRWANKQTNKQTKPILRIWKNPKRMATSRRRRIIWQLSRPLQLRKWSMLLIWIIFLYFCLFQVAVSRHWITPAIFSKNFFFTNDKPIFTVNHQLTPVVN